MAKWKEGHPPQLPTPGLSLDEQKGRDLPEAKGGGSYASNGGNSVVTSSSEQKAKR